MGDNGRASLHETSVGGVIGKHESVNPQLLVGPSTSNQFNTATLRLIPVPCFRVDDIRFAFDSSFVTSDPANEKNDIRAELNLVADLGKSLHLTFVPGRWEHPVNVQVGRVSLIME